MNKNIKRRYFTGDLFRTPCSSDVVQPFAQIADKFNEMQLGMIADFLIF
jgi:hypothetical protein